MRIIDFGITMLFIYSHFCHNFITKLFSVCLSVVIMSPCHGSKISGGQQTERVT